MKRYTIVFKELGASMRKTFIAEDKDYDLGQEIMKYIDEKYSCNSYTDGKEVWYNDATDEQITVITDMQIMEEEEV